MIYRRPTIEEVRAARARTGAPPLTAADEAAYLGIEQSTQAPATSPGAPSPSSFSERFDTLMTRLIERVKNDPDWQRRERWVVRGRTGGKFATRISAEGPSWHVHDLVLRDIVFWLGMEPEFVERVEEELAEENDDAALALASMRLMADSGLMAVYDQNTWEIYHAVPRRKQ